MTRQVRGSGESARPAWARRYLVAFLAPVVAPVAFAAFAALAACNGSGDDSSVTLASTLQDSGSHDATGSQSRLDAGAAGDAAPVDATMSDDATAQDAGVPAVMLSASSLDFGSVGCSQTSTRVLTVTNAGAGLLAVNAATTGVAFAVSPTSLSLEAGAAGLLTVTAAIPGSATAGTAMSGSLQLFTNDPTQTSASISLTAKPAGATLTYSPTSPTTASFPSTETSKPASPIALYLVNTGNIPTSVTFGPPSDPEFSLSGAGTGGTPTTLPAGGAVAVTAGFTPAATTTTMATASAAVSVSGTSCGTNVSSLSFAGTVGYGQIQGWPTGPIDFGPADCGGGEPMYQLVVLTNSGSVDATITSATITGAPGFSSFAQGVAVPAGGSGAFAVHAPPVPALSPTTAVSATLTIQTDAETTSHSITLTEEPRGAVLAFDTSATPHFGSFGQVVLLQAASQNFSVVNTGTGPATVTLSTGSGGSSPFAVSNPTFAIPANGTQTDAVTFTPTSTSNSGSITMTASGALCAALPPPLPLSGASIGGGPVVSPSSLSFVASCGGAAPAAQSFSVSNKGNANLNWSMSGVTGAGSAQYKVSATPPPGLLMPGQSSTVTVTAAAIASPAPNLSPSAYAAQIVITTDVPFDDPHPVTLGETPLGDQLSFSLPNLRFGQFPINASTIAQNFTVTNNANPGSPAANVSLALNGSGAGAYSLSPTSIANLGPSGSVSSPASVMFRPTTTAAYPATVALATSDSLCTPLPSPIQLSGTGTQGKVSVSATTLAFGSDTTDASGLVNCGATGPAHTFTVSNVGNQQFNITGLSLGMGASSPYVLSGDATTLPATIPIGGSTTITVTPNMIPANVADPNDASRFTDTLTVTTDAALDSPHSIALVMQARGAVIAATPLPTTSWAFGTLGNGLIGTFSNTITNTGNAAASVSLQGLQHPTVFGLQNAPTIAAPNAVTDVVGQFSPPATNQLWTDQGTLVVTAAQAFCEPLPTAWSRPTVTLSGSSISGSLPVTVSGSLAFPSTKCGSAAPAAQSITLTNTTNVAYVFTAQLNSGQFYTLQNPTMGDASAGIIPGNGVVVLGVTPQTVTPGPGAVAGSAPYADELIVDIQSPTPSGVTIPISWTLDGAMLSLPQGAGPNKDAMGNEFYVADSQSGFTLPMDNGGTGTATVQFGMQPSNAFTFSPAPPISVEPNIRALPRLLSASSDAACPSLTSGSATFLYSGPVCRPFPLTQVTIQSCVGTY